VIRDIRDRIDVKGRGWEAGEVEVGGKIV